MSDHATKDSGLQGCFTLVLWVGCVIIGMTGLVLPHRFPRAPAPLVATLINVSIAQASASPTRARADAMPIPGDSAVTPAPQLPMPSSAPPMQAIAKPSARVAFALPVNHPGGATSVAHSGTTVTPAGPDVQHLVYGQGEGQQPAPEYPREAVLSNEQGTVVVRFIVSEDGRVRSATAVQPCSSPILNSAAVHAVRDSWTFQRGAVRLFEVSIVYQLNSK